VLVGGEDVGEVVCDDGLVFELDPHAANIVAIKSPTSPTATRCISAV
jgi:hypothetical protein